MELKNSADIKVRLVRHYLVLSIPVIITFIIFYVNKGQRNTIAFIAWASGYISFVLLAVSLIQGSLNILLKRTYKVSTYFRRDLGITAGILALLHSATGLFVHLRGKTWLYFLTESNSGYSIRLDDFGRANYTGVLSAILIMVLLITSNDRILRRMTPSKWKNVQRLSYLMFALVLVHSYFYRAGNSNKDFILFFYIPVILVVMVMQGTGALIRRKKIS